MKKLPLKINVSRGTWTDFADQPYDAVSVVNGDSVLFVAHFQEVLGATTVSDLDLTGALALRLTVQSARAEGADDWTFQDSYNQGDYAAYEVLSEGKVTWLTSFNAAAITSALGTDEYVDGYLEIAMLDPSNYPQTLIQIPIRIYAQLDDGAAGSPPPTTPTYLTATEVAAGYFDHTDSASEDYDDTDDGQVLVAAKGWPVIRCDTTTAGFEVVLPSAADEDAYRPTLINTGGNTLTYTPDGTETVNGQTGSQTIATQYGGVTLIPNAAGTGWIAVIPTIPA